MAYSAVKRGNKIFVKKGGNSSKKGMHKMPDGKMMADRDMKKPDMDKMMAERLKKEKGA